MKMKTSLPIVLAFTLLVSGVLSTESVSQVESQKARNGTILEIAGGFPYTTYEQWLDRGRSQMAFDEARIRSQFPPEKLCKTTPILLLQGSDDQRCVPESALDMGLQLQRSRQPFRLIFFESGSHGLSEHTEEVNRQTILWFEKHLRRRTDSDVRGHAADEFQIIHRLPLG